MKRSEVRGQRSVIAHRRLTGLGPLTSEKIMECKKFELAASAYLDRQLSEPDTAAYRTHLATCADCSVHLEELEQVSRLFGDLSEPETPRELHSYVMTEVKRQAHHEITLGQRLLNGLLKFNPRVVAYTAGLVISLTSFGMLFSSFRPIPVGGIVETEQAAIFPVVSGSDREYHSYNGLPSDSAVSQEENYYQLPRMLDNSALVSFSHMVNQRGGNEGISAMVEIDSDGRANLINVIDGPKDPYVVEQLWWSLHDRIFQPATVSGRPVPTRIILLVEKVDVSG